MNRRKFLTGALAAGAAVAAGVPALADKPMGHCAPTGPICPPGATGPRVPHAHFRMEPPWDPTPGDLWVDIRTHKMYVYTGRVPALGRPGMWERWEMAGYEDYQPAIGAEFVVDNLHDANLKVILG